VIALPFFPWACNFHGIPYCKTEQVERTDKSSYMYSRDTRFKSRPRHRICWYTFRLSLGMTGWCIEIGHNSSFLSAPFSFSKRKPPLMLYVGKQQLQSPRCHTPTVKEGQTVRTKEHIIACRGCCVTYKTGLHWMIGFIAPYTFTTRDYRQYSAVAGLHTLQFNVTHPLGSLVFASRIVATDL
jgi:hypothetical protein